MDNMMIKTGPQSPEQIAALEQFHEDVIWFMTHRKELATKYPDQWVAVYLEEVVGASEDIYDLMAHLKANNVPIGSTYVDFAATKPKVWII